MFSPEGYVGFSRMTEFISDWAHKIYLAYLVEELGNEPERVFRETKNAESMLASYRLKQLRSSNPNFTATSEDKHWRKYLATANEDALNVAVIFHCIFSKLLMRFDTLLVSSEGNIMRPDDYIFLHLDRLDWVDPCWPIRNTSALSKIFEYFDKGRFGRNSLADRYCFIDFELGTICLKNNSLSGFKECSHFFDDSPFDRYYKIHVEPFLERAIVWREDDLPQNFPEFFETISAIEARWGLPAIFARMEENRGHQLKRGVKPTGARSEFLRRYPDGKPEHLSAEAVAAELTEAGFPISGRQVQNYDRERRNRK
ncbi:hypothetical protein ROA7450_00539 [Roseovarius albus]|uniref:Uncharacterized protein n=1 Tax=Roseovarius albus TaxID=1247867 RepID=A0A1X6YEJ1_9RHOB|nr:hypothetical protein [Roseovarius albus]SLN17250.1 hypothetical protein ROA7450_00539 [Roseovarius albus]